MGGDVGLLIIIALVIALLLLFFYFIPIRLWVAALTAGFDIHADWYAVETGPAQRDY